MLVPEVSEKTLAVAYLAGRLSDLRLPRIFGISFFALSILSYRSGYNRPVFGLWSYQFSVILLAAISVSGFVIARDLYRNVWATASLLKPHSRLLDLTILVWGLAYGVESIHDPQSAGRIAELNFFGSTFPVSATLDWIAATLLLAAFSTWGFSKFSMPWRNAVVILAAVLATLLLLEGVIRAKAMIAPTVQGFPTYTSALWRLRYVDLNHDGFRDTNHRLEKERGTKRLLLVGDSYTYGLGIKSAENRLGERLSLILNQKGTERWEIINAGLPDTHTLDHIKFLKKMLRYQPDLVILLYVFNDMEYLAPDPRNRLGEQPASILDRLHPARIFWRNSYLFQEIVARIRNIRYRGVRGQWDKDPYANSSLLDRHLKDLGEFVHLANANNALVRVVPFDITISSYPELRQRYASFVRDAAACGIPIWSMLEGFDAFRFDELIVNPLDAHPNELANKLAAEVLAEKIMTEIFDAASYKAEGRTAIGP